MLAGKELLNLGAESFGHVREAFPARNAAPVWRGEDSDPGAPIALREAEGMTG